MIMINDNDYSNPYNKSNDNKKLINKLITRVITLPQTYVVIETIIIEITKILIIVIMIMIVIIIVIYKILLTGCKIGTGEMQWGICK